MQNALPGWRSSKLGAEGVDLIPVKLTPASVYVNLAQLEPAGTLPEVPANPEKQNDRNGQVRLEEPRCVVDASTGRAQGNIKLSSSQSLCTACLE